MPHSLYNQPETHSLPQQESYFKKVTQRLHFTPTPILTHGKIARRQLLLPTREWRRSFLAVANVSDIPSPFSMVNPKTRTAYESGN
jgi:hypothetical protein